MDGLHTCAGRWRERVAGVVGLTLTVVGYASTSCTTFQGKYAEAESLYERCQAIREKVLGPEHPRLAATLHSRPGVLEAQVRDDGTIS